MAKGYNVELRKKNKQNFILNLIRNNENISRSEVKTISKFSMNTVLNGIEDLLKQGLIMETGMGESQGGRRPTWLAVNPDGGYFAGVEFYAENIFSVILNLKGEKIYSKKVRLERGQNADSILKSIKQSVSDLTTFLGDRKDRILGIGMGVPGLIDKKAGVSLGYGHIADWNNVPIKDEIEREFNIPVFLENNVKVMAFAHKWLEYDANNTEDFLFVCIRSGIGMACMLNDQLYSGRNEGAGEIEHFPLLNSTRRCYCGKTGCLVTEVSNNAILSKIREGMEDGKFSDIAAGLKDNGEVLEMDMFIKSVTKKQPDSVQLLDETLGYLGYALAAAITILNPSRVILWGDLINIGEIVIEKLQEGFKKNVPQVNLDGMKLDFSPWGLDLGAIGAASLVMQNRFNFFNMPI